MYKDILTLYPRANAPKNILLSIYSKEDFKVQIEPLLRKAIRYMPSPLGWWIVRAFLPSWTSIILFLWRIMKRYTEASFLVIRSSLWLFGIFSILMKIHCFINRTHFPLLRMTMSQSKERNLWLCSGPIISWLKYSKTLPRDECRSMTSNAILRRLSLTPTALLSTLLPPQISTSYKLASTSIKVELSEWRSCFVGDLLKANESMKTCNELDLADRYMNTKRTKMLLKNNRIQEVWNKSVSDRD